MAGAGRARDADAGQVVGLEDLLDASARDLVPGGRLAVAGHDDAVAIAQREHRRSVRAAALAPPAARPADARRPRREQVWRVAAEQVAEAGVAVLAEQMLPALVVHCDSLWVRGLTCRSWARDVAQQVGGRR